MNLIVCMNRKKLSSHEFARPIAKIAGESDIIFFHDVDEDTIKRYDKIILSGNPLMDNKFLQEIDKFKWIDTCDKPILGICAGFQVLVKKFGGELKERREIGLKKVMTTNENQIIKGNFEAYHLHSSIPDDIGELLELSKTDYYISAVRHPTKPIYGIIFHPEVRNEKIILNFID